MLKSYIQTALLTQPLSPNHETTIKELKTAYQRAYTEATSDESQDAQVCEVEYLNLGVAFPAPGPWDTIPMNSGNEQLLVQKWITDLVECITTEYQTNHDLARSSTILLLGSKGIGKRKSPNE